MADINLLQNTNTPQDDGKKFKFINSFGVILLIIVVLALAAVFIVAKQVDSQIVKANTDSAAVEKDIKSQKEFAALARNQSKLREMATLIDQHLSWSRVVPSFGEITLKTSKYTRYVANLDGSATISGTVPNFQDLDKLIKGFQLKNDYIKDVKLMNVALASEEENQITYQINVSFNKNKLLELTKASQSNGDATK
jgi:competence protein ComGC